MGKIPEDAIHWDSGDWINWHRSSEGLDDRPCSAAAEADPLARLTALNVSLLRAAKTYYTLTGKHLDVYQTIAEVYAAIHFDLPIGTTGQQDGKIKLLHLPPHGPHNSVDVDLSDAFDLLIVVRIKDNFTLEARTTRRQSLPEAHKGVYKLGWRSLQARH